MGMVWIIAGVALIGAIFFMLWKRDTIEKTDHHHEKLFEGLPI